MPERNIYLQDIKNLLNMYENCGSLTVDRREARVVPESKYSIGGIKNGISILFFLQKGGYIDVKY